MTSIPNRIADTQTRSLAKSISWRILATITTTVIVFLTTKEWNVAFTVGGIEVLAKFVLYYFHERMWQRIWFGRS